MLKNDPRVSLIRSWLTRELGWSIGRITAASADASFRRYFRISRGDVDPAAWAPRADTLIVMDAPPGKEDIAPYLKVTSLLEQAGVHVPHVHASDEKRGFVVMEDLGNTQYLTLLRTGRGVDKLYGDALTTLANIQVRGLRAAQVLAPYDRAPLARELNLMPEWFLEKHLGLELVPEERGLLTVTFEFLINEALLQPQVFVHRDFHSRNLMALPGENQGGPGVIDFQDALRGPVGYDLVSLLKDCYISWSRERVERWVRGYRRVLGNLGANVGDSEYQFIRWFDLIGVQRHLKVLGVFARLWHRDRKIGYLGDLPLTFEYVRDACRRYPELVEFERWLAWRVAPGIAGAHTRALERAARPPKPKRRKPAAKRKAAVKRKSAVKRKAAVKRKLVATSSRRELANRAARKAAGKTAVRRKVAVRKPARRKPAVRKTARKLVRKPARTTSSRVTARKVARRAAPRRVVPKRQAVKRAVNKRVTAKRVVAKRPRAARPKRARRRRQ